MGDIFTRKRGKKWQYSFEGAKIDNKRKRISKSGFNTKKEALEAGTKALAEYNEGGLQFTPSEMSYSDFLDFWIEVYCLVNYKDTTVVNYQKKIKNHIKPELGKYKLKAMTASVIQKFINKKAKEGLSRNTLGSIKGIMGKSFKFAIKDNLIRQNPILNVTLPNPRSETIVSRSDPHVYIPPARIKQIFERFPEGSSTHIPMMFGYKGGLRIGEAFAGFWSDLDFEKNIFKVNRQVQWSEKLKLWYFSAPKYDSYRDIDLDPLFMELLKREKERQEKAKLYYGDRYTNYFMNENKELNTIGDGDPISLITVRENGGFIIPRSMQHTSSVIHYQMDYPEFDFHSLRGTHATMLAEKGAPPKYLQSRMGHKTLEVTMKFYIHLTDTMEEKGIEIIKDIYQI